MKRNILSALRKGVALSAMLLLTVPAWSQSQRLKGYPQRGAQLDVLPGFQQPPKGY